MPALGRSRPAVYGSCGREADVELPLRRQYHPNHYYSNENYMSAVGIAFVVLFGGLTWVMAVDLVRAVRSGIAVFRVGGWRWSGPWENPISRLNSPLAFWSAVIWTALWVIALSIMLSAVVVNAIRAFL